MVSPIVAPPDPKGHDFYKLISALCQEAPIYILAFLAPAFLAQWFWRRRFLNFFLI
jgi:hypothetical protein